MWSQTNKKLCQTDTVFIASTPFIRIWLNVSHISLSLFSFLSILFRRAQNALKNPQARVCQLPIANYHKSDYSFWFIPTQKRNNVLEAKRRQQEKHSWCVINAWRKTQFENIWKRGLGQTAASWQIWVTFSDPYKMQEVCMDSITQPS